MPTYDFKNTKTNKIEEHTFSIKDFDQFKKDNPHLESYIDSPPAFSYSGIKTFQTKTDATFKEVMAKIAEQNPSSPLADKFGKKTIKDIKTREILKKHREKTKKI